MKNDKDAYWEGYGKGVESVSETPSVWTLVLDNIVPDRLPTEKGEAYEAGYNAGRNSGRR